MDNENNVVPLHKPKSATDALAETANIAPRQLDRIFVQLEGMTRIVETDARESGNERSALAGSLVSGVLLARAFGYRREWMAMLLSMVWDVADERAEGASIKE